MPSSKRSSAGKRGSKRKNTAKNAKRDIWGIILVAVGVLSVYFVLNSSVTGAGLRIRAFLRGLAGDLSILLPLVPLWLGLVLCLSNGGRHIRKGHIPLVLALFVLFLGFVEMFSVESISDSLTRNTFGNALVRAYEEQSGGGLIGMTTAWFFYVILGLRTFGSIILYIALFALILIALRKLSLDKLRDRAEAGFNTVQDKVDTLRRTAEEQRIERAAQRDVKSRYANESRTVIPTVAPRKSTRKKAEPDDIFDVADDDTLSDTFPVRMRNTAAKTAVPDMSGLEAEDSEERMSPAQRGLKASIASRKAPKKPEGKPLDMSFELPSAQKSNVSVSSADDLSARAATGPDRRVSAQIPDFKNLRKVDIFSEEDEKPVDIPGADADAENVTDEPYVPGSRLISKEPFEHIKPAEPLPSYSDIKTMKAPVPGTVRTQDSSMTSDIKTSEPAPAVSVSSPFGSASKNDAVFKPDDPPAEEETEYFYPPVDLLASGHPSDRQSTTQADMEKGYRLVEILRSFNIETTLKGVLHGPTVTLYELAPAAGVKVSRITNLVDDIALGLAAKSVRIEAPIPGKSAVGIEVPNEKRESVPLRDVLESSEARSVSSRIAAGIGRDNNGNYIICDIAKMPHLLIAGSTGSGKSVCINCIICSILYRSTPDEVRLILIDPKKVELSVYNTIPHLLVPVVSDPKKAAGALEWVVTEMGQRYEKFKEVGARDLSGYNKRLPEGEKKMPQIVVIIDELADLMMVAPVDIEDAICRIAQLARACGIHLVIATQRPSVNVITGLIKANIASRIAFTVASFVDSRTILDYGGAEKLLMRGDMLYAPSGIAKPLRVQGAWIDDDEVQAVVSYISERHTAEYDEDLAEKLEKADMPDAEKDESDSGDCDPLLAESIECAISAGEISVSMLQRKFRIGYARAGRLVDEMTKRGFVSEKDGSKPRTVLITHEQFREMFGGD